MTENDDTPTFSPSPVIENNENQKPALTAQEKLKERLRAKGKLRPVNLTQPKNGEIVLEVIERKKEEENEAQIDEAATTWIIEKANLKEGLPILITKSPKMAVKKRPINKQNALKKELQEKLKIQRKEEQDERYAVYNYDNEINDDEEEEEDDAFEVSENEGKTETTNESKKPKITVNEDEEIIEEAESEVDDEEELFSDEEEEEEERSKNPFVDDEASDDPDNDSEDEEDEEEIIVKSSLPSRIVIDDDDEEETDEPKKEIESLLEELTENTVSSLEESKEESQEVTKSSSREEDTEAHLFEKPDLATQFDSQLVLPNSLTQRLEPYEGQQAPIEPDPPQRSIVFDTQADKDELMMLCSGSFGTQKSDQTLCSKFEKYDVMDFLSDSSQIPETQSQDLLKNNLTEKISSDVVSDTQRRIDAIYEAFNNAEDSIDTDFSISDSECDTTTIPTRKRKIVVYSDDEEEIQQQSQPKHPKILDFDDDDVSRDASSLPSFSKPSNSLAMDFDDDIFTTEDTSNNPCFMEDIQSEHDSDRDMDDDDEEKDLADYGSDIDDDNEDGYQGSDKMLRKFVDDEASLSGDDVGDDPDEEDNDNALDDYELDEADKEVYDQEEVRNGIVKQHLKHLQNEDEKQLYRLQQKYFVDGDLHGVGNMDRSFRYRMRKDITDEDWEKLVKLNPVLAKAVSDDENDEDLLTKKKSFDLKKWKHEKAIDNEKTDNDDDLLGDFDSPLLSLGKLAMNKPISKVSTKTISSVTRGSLLNNPSALGILIKETVTETKINNTLFTAMRKP